MRAYRPARLEANFPRIDRLGAEQAFVLIVGGVVGDLAVEAAALVALAERDIGHEIVAEAVLRAAIPVKRPSSIVFLPCARPTAAIVQRPHPVA
jgi:hypothetical protein